MAPRHGSNTDVIGNGYVLSEFLNSASFSGSRDTGETTTFKKKSKTYIPGLKDSTMSCEGVYEGEADRVGEILSAALGAGTGIFSYIPAGQEFFGSPAYTMDAISTSYEVNTDVGDVAQISAELNMGDQGVFDRGRVVHSLAAAAADGQTAGLNNGPAGATQNGAALTVHATVSNNLAVKLQDSADGVTWADLPGTLTFVNGRGSKRLVVPGTVRQHIRALWTGTGTFLAIASRL